MPALGRFICGLFARARYVLMAGSSRSAPRLSCLGSPDAVALSARGADSHLRRHFRRTRGICGRSGERSASTGSGRAGLPPADTVVARVNGDELTLADVEAAQQSLPQEAQKMPLAQIYPMLLDRMVDGMLVAEAGRKEHLDQSPQVQRRFKLLQDRLIQQAYIEQLLKSTRNRRSAQSRLSEVHSGKAGARRGSRPPHPRQNPGRGAVDHRPAQQGRRFRHPRQEIFDRPGGGFGRRPRLFQPRRHGPGICRRRFCIAARAVHQNPGQDRVRLACHHGRGSPDETAADL